MSKRNSEFTDHLQRENLIIKINRCDQVNRVSEFTVDRVQCTQCLSEFPVDMARCSQRPNS
jgi:hypothetical protein